jgi:alpha-NAC-related protein
MFGSDPKKMEKLMKKLNLNVRQVEAEEVIIKGKGKKIVIKKPEIMIADMMGREVYQITGEVQESMVNEEDIQLVMQQTGKDRKTVVEKLEELDNDLAQAILELKEK